MIQYLLTGVFQPGFLHGWKCGFVSTFSDDAIGAIVEFFAGAVPGVFAALRSSIWARQSAAPVLKTPRQSWGRAAQPVRVTDVVRLNGFQGEY